MLTRVKQEVGLFYSDEAKSELEWPEWIKRIGANPVCGNGHVAFQITSVKMDFNVVNVTTKKGTAGLKIPFGVPGTGNIGPGGSLGSEQTGSVDLDYLYKPPASGPVTGDFEIIRDKAIILPALDKLRESLTRATGQKPCFQNLTSKDPVQTLTFTVGVKEDRTETLGFNFYLINLSGSNEAEKTGKNTIIVSFRPISFPGGEQNLTAIHEQMNADPH